MAGQLLPEHMAIEVCRIILITSSMPSLIWSGRVGELYASVECFDIIARCSCVKWRIPAATRCLRIPIGKDIVDDVCRIKDCGADAVGNDETRGVCHAGINVTV